MKKKIKDNIGTLIGESINSYHNSILKETVDNLKFKEEYQNRIIDVMVGEVDDNYITTPETNEPITKLEYSKEGVIKIPSIKGRTILVDANGSEINTPAEGCKLLSVGEEEDNKLIILSKNKNLFDNSERVNGYYWSADNTETRYDNSYLSRAYIKVNQETYVTNGNTQVLEYDKNKNFIRRVQVTNAIYIPNENVGYIRLSYYNQGIDFKGQFELSNKSTTYVEPKHHKTEILLNEPLRSIPNGVYDEIVDNKIIRRTTKVVLDGVENKFRDTYSAGTSVEGFYSYRYDNENIPLKPWGSMDCVVCNKYPSVNYGAWNSPTENCVSVHSSIKAIYVSLQNDMLDITSSDTPVTRANKANEWLKENPIEIVYELAEPIIEELPNSITLQGFDDTTMYIENSITPTVQYGYNALIPYKQELLNQQEEVEINTLDIENNIIPYLMDMEFNLMLMEDN